MRRWTARQPGVPGGHGRIARTTAGRFRALAFAVLGPAAAAVAAGAIPAPGFLPTARAQAFRPDQTWRVLESAHFRVTYAEPLDSLAARTASAAESLHVALTRTLGPPPEGKIDLVLSDDTDDSNGFANPFPTNRVALFAHPPVDQVTLGDFDEWMHGLLAHELTHIWQLDRAGRAGRGLRRVIGRPASGWPLFPVIGAPNWFIEGTAVSYETELTGRGRLAGQVQEMMLRTSVREGRDEPYDRIANPTSSWPASIRPYAFGSLFIDHLARRFGPDSRARLTADCAGAVIPPPLAFDRPARRAFDRSFPGLYRDWQRGLTRRYARQHDSLAAAGLTPTELLAEGGAWSGPLRFSPDGRHLVYRRSDWRRPDMTVLLDLESGRERELRRHDSSSGYAWLPGGEILTAELEVRETYRSLSRLTRIQSGGRSRALSPRARLTDPDVCSATGAVVAVENGRGATRLVLVDPATGDLIRRLPSPPEALWAHPRWSPDGARLAAERLRGGSRDIVVLDRAGGLQAEITADRASDANPAWSADGRFLVFASDRTGIWNLFAAAADDTTRPPRLRQVTNLIGGAFSPDLSPDGRWIAFSSYHADGMRIERIPCEPASWRDVAGDSRPPRDPRPEPRPTAIFASRPYRPWRSLRPYYWLPQYFPGTATGDYYGLRSSGEDLVGRHAWSAWAAADPRQGRWQGAAGYSWAGLGNPVLSCTGGQSWDLVRSWYRDHTRRATRERERYLNATATLLRRRMHSRASFSLGGELLERRRAPQEAYRDSLGAPIALDHARATRYGVSGGIAFANTSARYYSLGPEDGISAQARLRHRWGPDAGPARDRGETETRLLASGYRAVTRVAWSRAVVAASVTGIVRNGAGATEMDLGGVSEGILDLEVISVGGGGRLLPLRGFPAGIRTGTRAASGGVEGRIPLFLVERGINTPPLFLERTWAVAFVDAGDAWRPQPAGVGSGGCTHGLCLDGRRLDPLVSAGAELNVRGAAFYWLELVVRFGVARQLAGGSATTTYVALGSGGVAGASASARPRMVKPTLIPLP